MPKPHIIDRHGNHMESHGKSVFLSPASAEYSASPDSIVDVYSYFSTHGLTKSLATNVMMSTSIRGLAVIRTPYSMMAGLTPDDADLLASNLQAAAKRARAVASTLAAKGDVQ